VVDQAMDPRRDNGEGHRPKSAVRLEQSGSGRGCPSVTLPWRDRLVAEAWNSPLLHHHRPARPAGPAPTVGTCPTGVTDNVIMPSTLSSIRPCRRRFPVRRSGYRSPNRNGICHSHAPRMEGYGFSDWDGNDRPLMDGRDRVHFDRSSVECGSLCGQTPPIGPPSQSCHGEQPWFLPLLGQSHDVIGPGRQPDTPTPPEW